MLVFNNISNQFLQDIFVTALEGGSNYWLTVSDYCLDTYTANITDTETKTFVDRKIDVFTIKQGLEKLQEDSSSWTKRILNNLHSEDYDAQDADIVLQYGLFGKLIYG